jgi:Domain of unknown function (DUF4349)
MMPTDEQLATELRALRPTPSESVAADLDAWAAAGFPPAEAPHRAPNEPGRRRRRSAPRLWPASHGALRPALAGGATVILAAVVTIAALSSSGGGPGETSTGVPGAGIAPTSTPDTAGSEALPSDAAGGRSAQDVQIAPAPPVPPQPGEQLKPGRERVQERSASMTLSTEPADVDDIADGVIDVTDRYDGIVASSQVDSGDGKGRASFDLRVPTQNLQAALADLSDLAHVSSRNEGSLDITAPFVTAEERFGDAKAEVDRLLDQLAEADSAAEVAAIREQLRLARGELAGARSELAGLKQRAGFARLSVTVVGNGDSGGWTIGDAADDALGVLEALAGAALVTLAVLVPLSALLALVWLGSRELRRRRREAVLDR